MQGKSIKNNADKEKIKIIFMIPTLVAGGAERVIAHVSQNLNPSRFSSQLLVIGKSQQTTYKIDNIPVNYLEKNRVLHAVPYLVAYLRKEKPDVVLSSIGHLNMVSGFLSYIFPSIRFIIRPSSIESGDSGGWLARKCFSACDAVICQSHDMADNFYKIYGISTEKITIIGNPVTNAQNIEGDNHIDQTKNFITVGRLNKIKGHERILDMLAKLDKDFHYTIIGDGPERESLMTQIDNLQLKSKITHISYTDKVNKYLLQNDLFLQGSYSEGFPNAVLESCTMGTPALAFDVPGGTKEIIQHGTNGFLVDNDEEYLAVLSKDHKWKRSDIRDSVLSNYSSEMVIEKYEKLLFSIL